MALSENLKGETTVRYTMWLPFPPSLLYCTVHRVRVADGVTADSVLLSHSFLGLQMPDANHVMGI